MLTACGTDAEKAVDAAASSASSAASSAASGAAGAVKDLAKKADIPVGGGTIIDSAKVVITQPTEGEFKAFTAVCPHQQCLVTSIKDEEIDCSCHGSKFSITDGSVVNGPAVTPLPARAVTVSGDSLSVA